MNVIVFIIKVDVLYYMFDCNILASTLAMRVSNYLPNLHMRNNTHIYTLITNPESRMPSSTELIPVPAFITPVFPLFISFSLNEVQELPIADQVLARIKGRYTGGGRGDSINFMSESLRKGPSFQTAYFAPECIISFLKLRFYFYLT